MMQRLDGKPVVQAMAEKFKANIARLNADGVLPKLAIVRVGSREDDIAYERGIQKRFSSQGISVEIHALPADISQSVLENTIASLNNDHTVHGILIFRPLPRHLDSNSIKSLIAEEKDVDCMGTSNMAHVFAGNQKGYPPCTAQAVIELIDYYGTEVAGKRVVIVGRSLVVGKPLAMLLLTKNATVTICHTKTVDLAEECKRADILVCCAGVAKMITGEFVKPGQIVIDVGINMDGGKLCGDVDYDSVVDIVEAITPVPGGIGGITTSVLLKHTIQSAMRSLSSGR